MIEDTPNELTIIEYANITNLNLPDKLKVPIKIYNNIENKEATIKVEIERSEINKYFKKISLNKNIKVDNGTIHLDSISFSPFGAVFIGENIGKWYLKYDSPYRIAILDDNGKEIEICSSGASYDYDNNIVTFEKELQLEQYNNLKNITIKVYDTRTGKELKNSSVTIDIPKLDINRLHLM